LRIIGKRFPGLGEILPVLGATLFACHGWSLRGFFNELPSFMLYFKFGEIATIFAYMMAFALLESLIVVGGLCLLGALLPPKWLRDGFAYKGFVVVAVGAVAAVRFQRALRNTYPPVQTLMIYLLVPLAIMAIVIIVAQNAENIRRVLLDISDRFSIMLYVFLPIGLVSLFVVVARNLL